MSMKAFRSKLSSKGYSSKNATVQCIQVLYTCLNSNETSYTITSRNFNNQKKEANKCEGKKFIPNKNG